jgi:cytochrome P450
MPQPPQSDQSPRSPQSDQTPQPPQSEQSASLPQPLVVSGLDLPTLDTVGLERREAVDAIAAARAQHWLARTDLGYAVTRLEDVTAILRDQRFHSALSMIEQSPELEGVDYRGPRGESILTMEGVQHARLRRLVAPAFTPASANRLRPTMRAVVGSLVDAVAERGECELVADVCEPYPIPIICELLGAPPEDWKLFSGWATDIFRIFNNNLAEDLPLIAKAGQELTDYVSDMIAQRRADPRDDLLSDLISIEQEGDRLSTDEMAMLAQAVLMAGTDTTRNQLACTVALFSEHPEQWALLAEQPELAGRAVEESMRYLGAVRGTARFASQDIVYRGVLFPQGTLVMTSLAGANRDPEAFEDPDAFDITRERTTAQMTFGAGIHFCMGAALARAELQEALPLLAKRMPHLRPAGDVEWKPSNFGIWGPARLPLRFEPTAGTG